MLVAQIQMTVRCKFKKRYIENGNVIETKLSCDDLKQLQL